MTTIRVRTTVDVSKIEGAARQVPFALSKAINATLIKAQAKQRAHMAAEFTIRRKPFMERSVKITRFAKKASLIGELAIASPGDRSDIFAKFEQGGTKRPKDGHSLAIPIVGSPVKRSTKTVVLAKNRPRALLDRAQTTNKRGKAVGGAFLRPAKDGKPGMIFMRTARGLKLAYVLEPAVPIKPELHFVDTVTKSIDQTWEQDFAEALANALSTARK